MEWGQIALFASGAIIGITVGVSAALLFAPQSGAETRRMIGRRGRYVGHRTADAWDDLRHEFNRAARRSREAIGDRFQRRRARRERQREIDREVIGV